MDSHPPPILLYVDSLRQRLPRTATGTFAPDDGHRIGVGLPAVGMVTLMIVVIITGGAGRRPPELGLRGGG
jgi:hypothetical protein